MFVAEYSGTNWEWIVGFDGVFAGENVSRFLLGLPLLGEGGIGLLYDRRLGM